MVEITRDTDEVLNYAIIRLIVSALLIRDSSIEITSLSIHLTGRLERTIYGIICPRHSFDGTTSNHGYFTCRRVSHRVACIIYAYRVVMSVVEVFKHWRDRPTASESFVEEEKIDYRYERVVDAQGRQAQLSPQMTRRSEHRPETPSSNLNSLLNSQEMLRQIRSRSGSGRDRRHELGTIDTYEPFQSFQSIHTLRVDLAAKLDKRPSATHQVSRNPASR